MDDLYQKRIDFLKEHGAWADWLKNAKLENPSPFVRDLLSGNDFLLCSFLWMLTTQGHDYWENLENEASRLGLA